MQIKYRGYMYFSSTLSLLFLIFIPILILFFIIIWKNKLKDISSIGDSLLLKKLIPNEVWERQKIKMILLVVIFFFFIITLAGPQFGTKLINVKRSGVDVIICVDTSLSMLAEDIKPNRFARAKEELGKLIQSLDGNRIGIIAFAGTSFLQCPLTLDNSACKMFLDYLDIGIIPQQGTEIGTAIRLAIKTFNQSERKYKAIVLLTDGEDHESGPIDAASEAKKQGIVIFTIGFGNESGEVIPIKDSSTRIVDYKKDSSGATVVSKLDSGTLKEISNITGGKYYQSETGQIGIDSITDSINNLEKKELSSTLRNQYEDRFYYFAFIVLILLLLEFFIKEVSK
jgi:Ca-activated chloride channel homolog